MFEILFGDHLVFQSFHILNKQWKQFLYQRLLGIYWIKFYIILLLTPSPQRNEETAYHGQLYGLWVAIYWQKQAEFLCKRMSGPKSYKWLSLELNWTMSFFGEGFCHIAEKLVALPFVGSNSGHWPPKEAPKIVDEKPSHAYVTIFNDFHNLWACFKPLLKLN